MRVWMESYDFIVTPIVATPAFDTGRLISTTAPGAPGSTGPCSVIPFNDAATGGERACDSRKTDCWVGLQITGKMYDDAGVLVAARAMKRRILVRQGAQIEQRLRL